MSRPMKSFLVGFFLALGPLSQVALAVVPDLVLAVTLTARWRPEVGGGYSPVIHSYATAALWDAEASTRLYRPLILQHAVGNSTEGYTVFTANLSSPHGQMSSSTRDLPGNAGHCYVASAVAHVNDFNLHARHPDVTECMPARPDRPEIPEENCPVLVDLGMDGFRLSGPDPAVSFDIDADGTPDQIAWTRGGGDDAFLCLDRNGNGLIDDGTELFGYATPLLSGQRARIGYRALADLDRLELGGNDDGKINARDAIFHSLCVWNDSNRDGVSQQNEIEPAAAAGVVSLDYAFRETRMRDSFGNLFRYVSRAEMRNRLGKVRSWLTYDVIFADSEP